MWKISINNGKGKSKSKSNKEKRKTRPSQRGDVQSRGVRRLFVVCSHFLPLFFQISTQVTMDCIPLQLAFPVFLLFLSFFPPFFHFTFLFLAKESSSASVNPFVFYPQQAPMNTKCAHRAEPVIGPTEPRNEQNGKRSARRLIERWRG